MHSSGIIFIRGGEVLLGEENGGWSSFGGKMEPGEDPWDTATRETEEETAGVVNKRSMSRGTVPFVVSETPGNHTFVLFIVFADIYTHSFWKKRCKSKYKNSKEKKRLMWFPLDSVSSLRLRPGFKHDWWLIKLAIEHQISMKGVMRSF